MIQSNLSFGVQRFPCGEQHVSILPTKSERMDVDVVFDFHSVDEIMTLLLFVDAAKNAGHVLRNLEMPYVPFGRQDRVANPGENFSLRVFADLINGLGFQSVNIVDPHSDVTPALLRNVRIRHQHEVFKGYFAGLKDFHLISPDGGALKKIYKLAKEIDCSSVIECSKWRDTKTGAITRTIVHAQELNGRDCYIVDDICDGGGTFIAIAIELRQLGAGKIHLMVSHGFFTKGLDVFAGLIDHIYTAKGQIK